MSYRFLPWVRRGLAAAISDADPLTADPPARARFNVRVALSTGNSAAVDLRLYGPGDVIGIDTRAIVRVEPRRFARDFPPDQFASVEFDPPDFPWMFTPAATGAQDRLRPWLVLVVVEKKDGVHVDTPRNQPLPELVIEPPASPGQELPDLAESWAGAHAHVVEQAPPASVAGHLRDNPNLNVSRLLCPRRLAEGRDYYACLVPAFEAGRLAGLGQTVPEPPTGAPAWGGSGSVGASITLPLYFHWEFRTGPAGDFEALARRLTPRPVPDNVGFRRMFIGAAHPALPALPADDAGIVKLEGALRAPEAGAGTALGPDHAAWVGALTGVVNAPAQHVVNGAAADAEVVGPPIYGSHHAKVHTLGPAAPTWLRELNQDPRHRAAAGLGTEIVRINQERFMQAAWEQVGDVLAANALLDRARFIQQVVDRVHRRHVGPLRAEVLLSLTAAVHGRVLVGDRVLDRVVDRSTLPTGSFEPAFRRMTSPRAPVLTKATRLAVNPAATTASVKVVADLARGRLGLDLLAHPPDGLVATTLLDRFDARPEGELGRSVLELRRDATALRRVTVPDDPVLRPDLAISGMVLPRHAMTLQESGTRVTRTMSTVLKTTRATPGGGELRVREVVRRGRPQVEVVAQPPPGRATVEGVVLRRPVTDPQVVGAFAEAFQAHRRALVVGASSVVPAPATLDLARAKNSLVAAVDPKGVIEARAALSVRIAGHSLAEGVPGLLGPLVFQREPLDQVMVGPRLPEPLYLAVAKADPDRFLPGIGEIPDDTVTMLETNPRFVEAFLVGANHEMNRELLWRRYPTDRRGTPFRRFWDRFGGGEDIGAIHQFPGNSALGTNGQDDLEGLLVLLVRGQLLRRYPNSVVYAVPARADRSIDPDPALMENPVFWGRIDPDVTFVGFDLTREDVEDTPGWYFVIAEQPTEPRFGFDTPLSPGGGVPASWSDVDWDDLAVPPNAYLRLAGSALNNQEKPVIQGKPATARFGRNAADMAAICFQRPFRAAIHSSKVIEGADPATGPRVRPILANAVLLRPITAGGA